MNADGYLDEYAASGDEHAFHMLADHYSGLVFASALRRTGSPEAAEEIVQNVFVALARKAQRLREHPALSAWLYRATMLESANFLRRESKRAKKMDEYRSYQTDETSSRSETEPITDLDSAIDRLPGSDRSLILLRYFDGKSFREIGEALGKSEVASRKQAERALEKLGRTLRTRGVTATATGLATALGVQLGETAPTGVCAIAAKGSEIATMTAPAGVVSVVVSLLSKPKFLAGCAALLVGIAVAVAIQQMQKRSAEKEIAAQNAEGESAETGGRLPSAIPQSNQSESEMTEDDTLNLTPTGICQAVRDGDLPLIKRLLAGKPELLTATNPANWANLPEMRVHPWAARPVEISTVFGHAEVASYLLSLSATEKNPIGGYYEAFEIALKMEDEAVTAAITQDVIRRVTERPELIDFKSEKGRTILFFATGHRHLGLMQELLDRGADPSAEQSKGRRPIHDVAGDNAETRLLIERGIDYDLWVAAAAGDTDRAREILAVDPAQVAVDFKPFGIHSDGLPLVIAASHGHLEMVRLLLDHGADVNGRLPGREFADDGLAILYAFTNGHHDVVNLLLDHGADTSAWVDSNYNFKERVRESDQQAIKDRVLTAEEQNPPIKSPSFVPWTGELHGDIRQLPPPSPRDALGSINAALVSHNRHHDYANYKEIITVMLEQGADQNAYMDAKTEEQKKEALEKRYWHREHGTPLHWLSTAYLNKKNYSPNPDIPTREELVDLAGLFLEHGANIEARHPISNHTPLSSAVEEGIIEYVVFLLEHGAVVNRDDPPETNPIDLARKLGFKDIAEVLREH